MRVTDLHRTDTGYTCLRCYSTFPINPYIEFNDTQISQLTANEIRTEIANKFIEYFGEKVKIVVPNSIITELLFLYRNGFYS